MEKRIVHVGKLQLGTSLPTSALPHAVRPHFLVPLTGTTGDDVIKQAQKAETEGVDIAEWRIDFFDKYSSIDSCIDTAQRLVQATHIPILATFRTKREGGNANISAQKYTELLIQMSKIFPMVDIEVLWEELNVSALLHSLSPKTITIGSHHNFSHTPHNLLELFHSIEDAGVDITKIACMPEKQKDVENLLHTTEQAHTEICAPIISISMGELGKKSRTHGHLYGSCATFGSLEGASAPGQLDINTLRNEVAKAHL